MAGRSRRDGDDMGTAPLFDEPTRSYVERARYVRPVGFGRCPLCHNEKAAVMYSGRHDVWRTHTYRTWSGAPITCGASGIALCVAPARLDTYGHAPYCRCGKGRP